jgi:hypothetical protein
MPPQRQAVWSLLGPEDQTITLTADFDRLTLTRKQENGYQREPDGTKPISPAAAQAFWTRLEALAAKGFRGGSMDTLDAVVWEFTAKDGKKTYAATGLVRDHHHVGDAPAEDSFAELGALFELLKR